MSKRLKVRTKKGWVAYPGSSAQQTYAEPLEHGYLLWEIEDRNNFDVKFCNLPNPRPYVTIDWQGSVKETVTKAQKYVSGSRFRIRHKEHISHKDSVALTTQLCQEMQAMEVTFKNDQ